MSFVKNDAELAFVPEAWEYWVEGGLIVVRVDTPSLFYLNASAAHIWMAYRMTGSKEEAANALVRTFAIRYDTAIKDVLSTLSDWIDNGLLGPLRRAIPQAWDGSHREPLVIAYCCTEGRVFLLLTDCPEFMADVAPRLDPIRIQRCTPDVTIAAWRSADDVFVIVVEDDCIATEQGVGATRAVLFQEIVRLARPGRQWLALLHAAACGLDDRCVLLSGSSYSGKSTLSAALTRSDFALYSDDFVGIEVGTQLVPPMPFAIAVRPGSWQVLKTWIPEIDCCRPIKTLGGEVKFLSSILPSRSAPGAAVALVFTEWMAGSKLSLETLSTSQAVERLNQSGFWVAHEQKRIGDFVALLQQLPKYQLRYGDLAEAVEQIKSVLANC
jgi:hypothetical protein